MLRKKFISCLSGKKKKSWWLRCYNAKFQGKIILRISFYMYLNQWSQIQLKISSLNLITTNGCFLLLSLFLLLYVYRNKIWVLNFDFLNSMAFQLKRIKMRWQENILHWRITKIKTMCNLTEKLTEQPWETEASLAANLVGWWFFFHS